MMVDDQVTMEDDLVIIEDDLEFVGGARMLRKTRQVTVQIKSDGACSVQITLLFYSNIYSLILVVSVYRVINLSTKQ